MSDDQSGKWRRLPKPNFTRKAIARRMKKVEGATIKHAHRFVVRRWSSIREVRRHIALWVITMGLILGATGLQFMWYQQSYRTIASASDGTYAEGVLGPVETINPIFASSSAEQSLSRLLFSQLLNYDTTGNLNYDLAEAMEISKDQKTYTVTIRPDARWQDGIYVRAKDVVFTVNLLKDPDTRATITGWDDITVKEVDDRTVAFTLPAVYAAFPHALSGLPILPEHILRDVEPSALRENSFSTNPVGSGPFSLRFIQSIDETNGRKIVHLAGNDTYYNGAAKIDRLQLHVYDSTDEIIRAITTAEVTAATDLTVTDANKLPLLRYEIERKPVSGGVYALFNTTDGVLNDKDIRKALQVGTDTEALRALIGPDTPALHLPFVNGQISGKVPAAPTYSVKKAGELLDAAGWKLTDGSRTKDGETLQLKLVTTNNNDIEKAFVGLASQWRDLGITVTTSVIDPRDPSQNIAQNVLKVRNYDVLVYQLTIGADPDVYAYWHSSQANGGFNFSNYDSAISDEALQSARTRLEPDLRNAKYLTFARQWLRDAPAIGLYQATTQYVSSKSINAIPETEVLISATDRYADVLYWSVGDRIVQQTP